MLSFLKSLFTSLTSRIQRRVDVWLGRQQGVWIVPYRGFSNGKQLFLKGRVIRNPHSIKTYLRESKWKNLLNTYRRFVTDELPGVEVELQWGESVSVATTDSDGYFTFQLAHMPKLSDSTMIWQQPILKLVKPPTPAPVTATAEVLVLPATAQYGIISDIDDTILISEVKKPLKMIGLAFLRSVHRRLSFEGVSAFYQALQEGIQPATFNPIFYVSSSPWNLYDVLVEFLKLRHIPAGPLMLRDYGLSRANRVGGHEGHKLQQIHSIMQMYPSLPFILIGDSGQQDPEIYTQVINAYPNRIQAIYIRDVTKDRRDASVLQLIEKIQENHIPMLLVPDTETAAQHAIAQGWINEQTFVRIKKEMAKK